MKNLIYLLTLLCFTACQNSINRNEVNSTVNANTNSASTAELKDSLQGIPANLEQIKNRYATYMENLNNKLLDSTVIQYNCQNERAGTITYYTDQEKILIISHKYSEYDHFQASESYFIADDQLFFSYQHQTYWSFEQGRAAENATKDDITELRSYFVNKQPILCLEKKYTIHSSSSEMTNTNLIPNQTMKCETTDRLLKTFNKLLNFKNQPNRECF